ncbi:MAG: hypothetical protein V4616_00910 [Bacteroidota bacterium]
MDTIKSKAEGYLAALGYNGKLRNQWPQTVSSLKAVLDQLVIDFPDLKLQVMDFMPVANNINIHLPDSVNIINGETNRWFNGRLVFLLLTNGWVSAEIFYPNSEGTKSKSEGLGIFQQSQVTTARIYDLFEMFLEKMSLSVKGDSETAVGVVCNEPLKEN